MTWKQKVTPAGRSYCQLVARGRRTSDSDCSGWPTPNVPNRGCEMSKAHRKESGGIDLQSTAQLTGWATPTTVNHRSPKSNQHGKNSRPLQEQAGLTSTSSPVPTGNSGVLEPGFPRWLQGYPESWDRLSPGYEDWSRVQDAIASGG